MEINDLRKKVEGRRKKHAESTSLLILISIISIGFHEMTHFSGFF